MPGRKMYAVALLIVLVGSIAAATVAYIRLSGLADHVPQVVVPGDADLTLSRAGTYTIYLERDAVVNGRLYSTGDGIEAMQVRISSATGSPIEMSRPSISSNYSVSGRSGTAVLAFTIAEPGPYHLSASYADGSTEPEGVLAVGLGVPERILTTILQAMSIAGISFVVGVIVAIVTFVKRRRVTRRAPVVSSPGPAPSL
jgi:hypothetical protein